MESKAAFFRRVGNKRPCSAFLRNGKYSRKLPANHLVEFLKQADGFEILLAAVLVELLS